MPLHLIATPIGTETDITLRAIERLKAATVVIGEERKEVSKLLKRLDIPGKQMELLNEHSTTEDLADLLKLCKEHDVALVTDCGTPGFCDPGSKLVSACRAAGVKVSPVPGASSLMCLLSVCGDYMSEFLFRGFLPADRDSRQAALRELDREQRPVVLMDTPYRLNRVMDELSQRWPTRRAVIGLDFTQETEVIYEAKLKELPALVGDRKAEFIIVIFPATNIVAKPVLPTIVKPVSQRTGGPGGPGPRPKQRSGNRR